MNNLSHKVTTLFTKSSLFLFLKGYIYVVVLGYISFL